MIKILGIAGSLRAKSYNAALLREAVQLQPEGTQIEIASIQGIPLYDGDVEASEGIPLTAAALKTRIAACDGLLLVTPEYNNSMPGVMKNAIDWLSRPNADVKRVFGNRPVAMIGASPTGFGTILAQQAWLPVLRTLGMRPWFGAKLMVSRADTVFDENGALTDAKIRTQLSDFLKGFSQFIKTSG